MSREIKVSEVESRGQAALIRVEGRLDAKNAQELSRRCREIRESGHTQLVINLSRVTFVASSGIGSLLALTEEFKEAGGCIHLVELSQAVESVVGLLNLTEYLSIRPTENAALKALEV